MQAKGIAHFGLICSLSLFSNLSQAVMIEELGRGDPGFTSCITQNWKVTGELARHASPELLDTWMTAYRADPAFLWAHCLSESRGASDRILPYEGDSFRER